MGLLDDFFGFMQRSWQQVTGSPSNEPISASEQAARTRSERLAAFWDEGEETPERVHFREYVRPGSTQGRNAQVPQPQGKFQQQVKPQPQQKAPQQPAMIGRDDMPPGFENLFNYVAQNEIK